MDDLDQQRDEAAREARMEVIRNGRRPDGKPEFAYLDTRFIAGVCIEFTQGPYVFEISG